VPTPRFGHSEHDGKAPLSGRFFMRGLTLL
jgi:hypothetical protein